MSAPSIGEIKSSGSPMPQPTVAILGAGLGGLTLGRCLRQKGVSSIIYERTSTAPRHGYGITLQPWAFQPLLSILGIDETTFRRQVAVDNVNRDGLGRISTGDADSSVAFRANRYKLESMLSEGQTIKQGHQLSTAEVSDTRDEVKLGFRNGLDLDLPQVVDALGVHSQLRKSMLPDVSLDVEPFAVYSGTRHVKPDLFASIYAPAFGNGNVIVRKPSSLHEPRLEIAIDERLSDGGARIRYIYSRPTQTNTGNTDPLHQPDRPKTDATKVPQAFYDEVHDFITTHNLSQTFIECFNTDKLHSDRLLHWLMRTSITPKQDLQQLRQKGVIMLGDSAHAVPILGGHGANMAILDAIKLANILAEQDSLKKDVLLEEFYEKSWQNWYDAVEESKRRLLAMHHPVAE